MAVSGNFDETVGLLTLSANSTIDFSGFGGTLRFGGIGSWASGATLAIWNWSGTTQYGTQVNNYANPSHVVFTDKTNLTGNLGKISFYSGSGIGFIGNVFEDSFSQSGFAASMEIIDVPGPEALFYAAARPRRRRFSIPPPQSQAKVLAESPPRIHNSRCRASARSFTRDGLSRIAPRGDMTPPPANRPHPIRRQRSPLLQCEAHRPRTR